jgi:hypothetical protein
MRQGGLARFAPLTGVAFVVLIVVAVIVGGETPDNDDSVRSIVNFWKDNDTQQMWSTLIGVWGTVLFVWFAGSLRSALRSVEVGPARLSAVSFGGALIGDVGLLTSLGLSFAAAESVDDVPGLVIQTLTVLSNELFFPIAAGFGLFFLATGILAVRTRMLPVWLGWITIVLGVVCITPAGFFALLVGLIWIVAVSVILFMRGPVDRPTPTEPAAPAPAR